MTVKELLARARSAAGYKTAYKLGAGGMLPLAFHPGIAAVAERPVRLECDCSGYTSWCFGRSRQTTHPLYVRLNGGWINTDAMVKDALDCTGFFTRIELPLAGCVVVYPGGAGGKIGHVGIVTETKGGGMQKVIHCSSGNYRNFGDAIRETAPAVFLRADAIFAWYEGIDR